MTETEKALEEALNYIEHLEEALDVSNTLVDKLVEEVAAFEFTLPGESPLAFFHDEGD